MTSTAALERDFYRTLNHFIEPWVMAGAGAPLCTPVGLIVLETAGRHSGEPRRTPLVATVVGESIVAGTFRGRRSHWVSNAIANPSVRYWLGGSEHAGIATFISAATPGATEGVPAELTSFVEVVLGPAILAGWAFVVIRTVSPV
jgi:deazaflavin-dependent oxidoreductase (nitroreductase family)